MNKIVLFGNKYVTGPLTPSEMVLRKVANLISIIFHPMMMPIYAIISLLYGTDSWHSYPMLFKSLILLHIGVCASLLPLLTIVILVVTGKVGDPEMANKSERILPLLFSTLIVGAMYYLSQNLYSGTIRGSYSFIAEGIIRGVLRWPIINLIKGMFVMLITSLVITPLWKISLHSTGAGALLSFVCIMGICWHDDITNMAAVAFALTGLIAWARLYLGSHTPLQLLGGFVSGFAAMTLSLIN